MKVPSHVIRLYHRTVRRYKKIASRLRNPDKTSPYQYQVLLQQLKKLKKKITDLHFQLKIATATGVLFLTLSITDAQGQTNNGPFNLQPRSNNPLREPFKFDGTTYPAVVDLDKDGDYDLVVGDEGAFYYGYYGPYIKPMRYLVNVGTNTSPLYEERTGEENPFDELEVLSNDRGPAFADIDEDGDEDLFVGMGSGEILYFRNDEGVFIPDEENWDPSDKTGNPLFNAGISNNAKIAFVDLDGDSDLDAIIGGYGIDNDTGASRSINYYKNDGDGNFTQANTEITISPLPTYFSIVPSVADVDGDGELDLVTGSYYQGLHYYRQVSPMNFVEETGTANPFDAIHFPNTQPVFVDLDHDNDPDLLLGEGDGDYSYDYPDNIIHYYENTGNGIFKEKLELENPAGGADVGYNAGPVLFDVDGDNDLDALIGNKYDRFGNNGTNSPVYYKNDDGIFKRVVSISRDGSDSPFSDVALQGIFYHDVADVDGDGDMDVVAGDYMGLVHFYRNDEGVYTEEVDMNPFAGIPASVQTSPRLADIDGDQDLDLILSTNKVLYFENTGTAQLPQYERRIGTENPFDNVGFISYNGFLTLADLDHDGDLDLLANENFDFKYRSNDQIVYYENTGTPAAPEFTISDDQAFLDLNITTDGHRHFRLQPVTVDLDLDGDLDVFIGDDFGYVNYVQNDNPVVVADINTSVINYAAISGDVTIIDPALTLADPDSDLIVQATVGITNFQAGDELTFTAQAGITGAFNPSNGILTFRGKAPLSDYQALLRTVAYEFAAPEGGRKKPSKKSVVAKSIEFRVYDTDFTNPVATSKNLNLVFNEPPAIQNVTKSTQVGTQVSIDLNQLISDPDNNIDLSSLRIVEQPTSGAFAAIDANHNLIIDYSGVNFTGQDQLIVEVCDDLGDCAQNLITIQVGDSGEIEVYNAVAPNSSGNNRYMRIFNLPEGNNVSIYSRWGDKVFEVDNYNNDVGGRRFEGSNDNGKPLPSGTYFYKIQIPAGSNPGGPEIITGYISLKQ